MPCPSCKNPVAGNARVCPNCGHRFTHPFVMFLAALFVLALLGAIAQTMMEGSRTKASSSASSSTTPDWVDNDADLVISRCGKPDHEMNTAFDHPQPTLPSRFLTYKRAHLKFAYLAAGDSLGEAPPYKWKFVGIIDTRTNKALKAGELEQVLRSRLPCSIAPR